MGHNARPDAALLVLAALKDALDNASGPRTPTSPERGCLPVGSRRSSFPTFQCLFSSW